MIESVLDVVSAGSAAVAATFFGLKANMLKPENGSWPDRPTPVRVGLSGLSIVLGGYVVAAFDGYDPAPGEAVILTAMAVAAYLLWRDLHGRKPD